MSDPFLSQGSSSEAGEDNTPLLLFRKNIEGKVFAYCSQISEVYRAVEGLISGRFFHELRPFESLLIWLPMWTVTGARTINSIVGIPFTFIFPKTQMQTYLKLYHWMTTDQRLMWAQTALGNLSATPVMEHDQNVYVKPLTILRNEGTCEMITRFITKIMCSESKQKPKYPI